MEVFSSLAVILGGLFLAVIAGDVHPPTSQARRGNDPDVAVRICVPEMLADSCHQMVTDASSHRLLVSCITARDRLNCLEKVSDGTADLMPLDPEDIHLATTFKDGLKIITDIRTNDKAGEQFRSKNVAVVHKNLRVKKISDLRGRKSCHTGIGRNAGLIITKLAQLGVLPQIVNAERSSRENELRAVSRFFGAACLVGVRSADPAENTRLKAAYPNLCALCADPARCDYPDALADADGALRCLTDKGGDVAWTKTFEVAKHFGLDADPGTATGVGGGGRAIAADFRFLCRNASKVPLGGGDECRWAARPWEAFVTGAPLSRVAGVRRAIGQLAALGSTAQAGWRKDVLALEPESSPVDTQRPLSPREYLEAAEYADVSERDFGVATPLRLCVTSARDAGKCAALAASAFSRAIRPRFACVVRTPTPDACMAAVRAGDADVVVLAPADVDAATSKFGLRPILSEQYGDGETTASYAVAVVKRLSAPRSLADLRGTRSCHPSLDDPSGWVLPLAALLAKGLVGGGSSACPPAKGLADFFSGSCVPGAGKPPTAAAASTYAAADADVDVGKLCVVCVGNQNVTNRAAQRRSRCAASRDEEFFGEQGALLCMTSGAGDVAFLHHATVRRNTDGKNLEHWAARLKSENYELICLNDTRAPVDQFRTCNLGQVPARLVMAGATRSEREVSVMRDAFINAAALYARRPELFRMFGPFHGANDVLFSDSARGLVPVSEVSAIHRQFAKAAQDGASCASLTSSTTKAPTTKVSQAPAWNWNKDTNRG